MELVKTPQYRQGLNERYKFERKFGEAKQGFGRCRYMGRVRFAVQSFFTAMLLNLKQMVKVLTGVGFKTKTASVV
jgi:IS5 family transposase